MNKLIKSSRLTAFFVLIAALLALCFATLYKLQIIEGAAYYQESLDNNVSIQTVTAARGNIMDRYGRVLVSNRECYNLRINTDKFFYGNIEDPNATILEMIRIIEESGGSHIDTLPITMEPPFEYTNLSDLQRTMLTAYFTRHGLAEDTSAVELMSYFRTRYDIDNNYSAAEMRRIAGIRYELNVRYAINTSDYIFVEDASIDLISALMGLVGNAIIVETSFVREYNTQYAAHLLGYIGYMDTNEQARYLRGSDSGYSMNDKVGKDGVELAFEDWLHGMNGTARVTSTAAGTVTSRVYTQEPVPGNHVYLTIDIQLQESVERTLESGIIALQKGREADNLEAIRLGAPEDVKEDVGGGAIVVTDVATGEPLAIASYPTYNLSTLMEDYESLEADERNPLFNRALLGAYAPGSTFKPVTALAALSENIINTETEIDCLGVYTEYLSQGYAPECWIYTNTEGQITHGYDNVALAVRDSCNYFFYSVADDLGITKLEQYARQFGLGEPTGIELVETTGNMANPDTHLNYDVDAWVYGDTLQAGIGQSDSLFTPLQISEYCAALANGGTRHSASILKSVRSYDYSRQLYENQTEVLSTVDAAAYNFAAVQYGMYLMTSDPNSSSAVVYNTFAYYSQNGQRIGVAAKTGTAQLGENRTNNAIFMCYAPYDNPEIAVSIVVEHGQAGANLVNIACGVLDAYFGLGAKSVTAEPENTLLQ